jgi:hypothetical protein
LRATCIGAELEVSNGVAALHPKLVSEALFEMRTFNEFDAQNDPYQIHDFGSFDIDGQTFLFQVQSRREDGERGLCKLMLSREYRGVVRYPVVEQVVGLGIEQLLGVRACQGPTNLVGSTVSVWSPELVTRD